jgi:formylglycine-generating enzyme required for sulfatase activity
MAGIFISYRRQESTKDARSLYERLRAEFGHDQVFIDLEGLDYGVDFVESLDAQLQDCRVLLALVGPHWLTAQDGQGRRRLDDPNDFVRIEVRTALERGIRVVPVLVDRAPMPGMADLPEDLHKLVRLQALELDFRRFDVDVGRLVRVIGGILRPGVPAKPVPKSQPHPLPLQPKPVQSQPQFDAGRSAAGSGGARHWMPMAIVSAVVAIGVAGYALQPVSKLEPQAISAEDAAAVQAAASAVEVTASPDPFPSGKRFRDCEDVACPWLVVVPAGSFMMGSPADEPGRDGDEGPQHRVSISKFAMGQFEVTQGQWKALMGRNPSGFRECGDDCPVENVSWNDVQDYAKKLSVKTGQKYRLPSEAEWEYAARAVTTTPYAFGATLSDSQANMGSKTVRVGSYPVNNFGLGDMHGNVYEWVQDCWHDNYRGAPVDGRVWDTGCHGEMRRVLRGGSWYNPPRDLRSGGRSRYAPVSRGGYTGFRIAKTF